MFPARRFFSTTHQHVSFVYPACDIPLLLNVVVDSPDRTRPDGYAVLQVQELRFIGGRAETLWRLVISFLAEPGWFVLRHGEFQPTFSEADLLYFDDVQVTSVAIPELRIEPQHH